MHNVIAAHRQLTRALWCLVKIAEQAQEGIAVLDFNGTVRFANTAWAAMHGYNAGRELLGRQISDFHTKEQMKTDVIPFIKEAKRRGRLAGPVEHLRKDGTLFLTQMKTIVVRDEGGGGIGLVCFITNIAELRQAEQYFRPQAEDKWQEYRNRLEQRIEEQAVELAAARERLKSEIARREHLERELAAANEKIQQQIAERERYEEELLESIIEADTSRQPVGPFNPQELKALSELAKRLS